MKTPANETRAVHQALTYRPGTPADSYAVFELFERTLADLVSRMGSKEPTSSADPKALARMWEERRPLYEHLAKNAAQFWIAEKDGELIGFARSTLHDGLQELTEFFVLPDNQSAGVGRELFRRAFPEESARHRSIMATLDTRAQVRYLKAGVYPRFTMAYFGRAPEPRRALPGLAVRPMEATKETLDILGAIDEVIIEHRRDVVHSWLLSERQGYLYLRGGQPVGYGYVGHRSGPFALLDVADYPAVLVHAETKAAERGYEQFGIEIPMINRTVVDYLLDNGFRMDSFMAVMMTNEPFGKFENYIFTSPPFFM